MQVFNKLVPFRTNRAQSNDGAGPGSGELGAATWLPVTDSFAVIEGIK
jgi:hypothetical protein